jgi:GGDEF domain-containing protein
LREADGSIVGAIEIFSDDSAQMETSRKIEAMKRLAFLDHLTQLPNRRFVEMSSRTALAEYQVHEGVRVGNAPCCAASFSGGLDL